MNVARILITVGVGIILFDAIAVALLWATRPKTATARCVTCGRDLGQQMVGLPYSCGNAWNPTTQRFYCNKEGV